MSAAHTTEEPQRTDSSRADAEWKADPGLGNVIHNAENDGSAVDRSDKAAPPPAGDFKDGSLSGGGSAGLTGNGDGKGPLDPRATGSKSKEARN